MAGHKHHLKLKKIFVYGILSFLIILGLICIWLYSGVLTPAKAKAFQILPLPIALVNGSPFFINDFLLRSQLSQKLLSPSVGNTGQTQAMVFDRLVREEQLRQLTQSLDIFVSEQEIDAEYQQQAANADLQGNANFEQLLASYGLTPAAYKIEVILPELRQIDLQTWFNSQPTLNSAAYSEADDLLQRIKNGEDMSLLAANFSADPNTKDVGGDMGFVDPGQTLPELREALSGMQIGEARILPSRFGLHIIRVEEKNDNSLHLRQIFLQTADFNAWYAQQTQKLKIKKLINF